MASGPLTMISVRLGSLSSSLIGLSSVGMSGMSAADGWEGARIMGQVLRKPQRLVSAEWTARGGRSAAELDAYLIGPARGSMNAGIPPTVTWKEGIDEASLHDCGGDRGAGVRLGGGLCHQRDGEPAGVFLRSPHLRQSGHEGWHAGYERLSGHRRRGGRAAGLRPWP